jgi:tagatose-6-phosphate ketose/aldose isomerase
MDLIKEIEEKKLTGKFLIVAPTDVKDNSLSLQLSEPVSDLYLPPLFVLVGQLLGLFASLREGLRPDEPSPRGAISRVVSHVTIY